MKRILYTIVMFCFFNGIAQLENANWYFGTHAGMNFTLNSATALANGETSNDGMTSTISDSTGQLLFYTDGHKIWNKNHVIMDGSVDSVNGRYVPYVLISPYPNHPNKYFIITTASLSGGFYEYLYSIVDMDANGGLGTVELLNSPIGIPNSKKESIIIAKHADGSSYWLITMKDKVFKSFLINDSGISTVAIESDLTGSLYFYGYYNNYRFAMSPSEDKLAFVTSEITLGTGRNIQGISPFLYVFEFDNLNATFSRFFDEEDSNGVLYPGVGEPISVEFSNNLLYVLKNEMTNGGFVYQTVLQFSLSNISLGNTYQYSVNLGFNIAFDHLYNSSIRRALDGKIYITRAYTSSGYTPYSNKLWVINSPDAYGSSCNLVTEQFDLLSGKGLLLPYLVKVHEESSCPYDIVITDDVYGGQIDIQSASNSIMSYNKIFSGANVEYKAGNFVILGEGFNSEYGSNFRAIINDCSIAFRNKTTNKLGLDKIENFSIYPNPTDRFITINVSESEIDNYSHVEIFDFMGVEKGNYKITKVDTKLDLSFLLKGLYILKYVNHKGVKIKHFKVK